MYAVFDADSHEVVAIVREIRVVRDLLATDEALTFGKVSTCGRLKMTAVSEFISDAAQSFTVTVAVE